MKRSLLIYLLFIVVAGSQTYHYYPLLPQKVGSHFGLGGVPDGWTNRTNFIIYYWVVITIISAIFIAFPRLMFEQFMTNVSIPERSYWLAEERKTHTFSFLVNWFTWLGTSVLCIVMSSAEFAFRANLAKTGRIDVLSLAYALATFLSFFAMWSLVMRRRFIR